MELQNLIRRNRCAYVAGWGQQANCDHPIVGGTRYCEEHRLLVADALHGVREPFLQREDANVEHRPIQRQNAFIEPMPLQRQNAVGGWVPDRAPLLQRANAEANFGNVQQVANPLAPNADMVLFLGIRVQANVA